MTIPIVLPSSWLRLFLTDYRFLLSGGCGKNLQDQLEAFWTCYKFFQPDHEIFKRSMAERRFTLPILCHGDEGRYLKKGNYMVCTIETVLGCDTTKKLSKRACTCRADPVLSRYLDIGDGHQGNQAFRNAVQLASTQHVNDTGNEFLSKFLLFGMSSLVYKKEKGFLTRAFDMVADDLTMLYEQGITIGDCKFFAATIGVKGDLKFHHQIGNLNRSYYNAGTKEDRPLCSHCLAGHPAVSFEDVSDNPVWLDTMHTQRPWDEGSTPSLARVPFQGSAPEAIFRLDLFHCYKCGIGRDLTGSSIIMLAQLGYFDFEPDDELNLPARLQRAFGCFHLYCRGTGKSPAIHSFTKSLFNHKNQTSFSWSNVKGSDNTLMTLWLIFFLKLIRQTNGPRHGRLELAMIEVLESAKVAFEIMHSHGLWMDRRCGQRVQHHLTVVVRGYKVLAKIAKEMSLVAFGLKPKLHACDHIGKELKMQLSGDAPRILNPMAFSCEANESVVGHVSRLSRRVSSRTVSSRVLDRVCVKMKSQVIKLRTRQNSGTRKRK